MNYENDYFQHDKLCASTQETVELLNILYLIKLDELVVCVSVLYSYKKFCLCDYFRTYLYYLNVHSQKTYFIMLEFNCLFSFVK